MTNPTTPSAKRIVLVLGIISSVYFVGGICFYIGQRMPMHVYDGTFSWTEISQENKGWYDLGKQVGRYDCGIFPNSSNGN